MNQQRLKELLHYCPETGVLTWRIRVNSRAAAGAVAGTVTWRGYRAVGINNKLYAAHRLAVLYMTGALLPKEVDHINGCRDDNRWENLRVVPPEENSRNKRLQKGNKTGIHGVWWEEERKMYKVGINAKKRFKHIGRYPDFFSACCARKSAELTYGYHHNHGRA